MAHIKPINTYCKQVALIVQSSNEQDNQLIKGIKQFSREQQDWSIYLCDLRTNDTDLSWLSNWKGDGILARIENEQIAQCIVNLNLPTIALNASSFVPDAPYVITKNYFTAQMAADHLLDKGFRKFAFYGDTKLDHSNKLYVHFQTYLYKASYPCQSFYSSYSGKSDIEKQIQLAGWIENLPKPIGIFACSQGGELLEACHLAGISVPDEVAVISFDDVEILCELLDRQLSNVILNTSKAGYNAALLLNHMMNENSPNAAVPQQTAVSSIAETLATKDKVVSDALNFIHSNACDGITVIDVLNEVPLSRRILERRFQQMLGRTPHEEIISARLKHVKRLLAETSLTLVSIADRTGFKHTEYLSVVFKREVGISPSQFRKLHARKKLTVNY